MKSNKKCVFNVNFQYNHKQVPTAYFSVMFNIHKHISHLIFVLVPECGEWNLQSKYNIKVDFSSAAIFYWPLCKKCIATPLLRLVNLLIQLYITVIKLISNIISNFDTDIIYASVVYLISKYSAPSLNRHLLCSR
jgi:hypothetical protein